MTAGIKANSDGSAAIQVGGTDVITLTSGGAATFVTSPTTVQAGTAAAPSITFSGDTDTGIFSPGANTLAFSTNGTEDARFDSSGNFVVGTTNPTNTAGYQTIEVNGASGGIVRASFSTTVKGYYFANSAGVTLGSESNDALMFRTNATERARFNNTGAFVLAGGDTAANGIGITFPATQSASSNANTLDDYEEGTFTPTLSSGFSSGPTSYTLRTGSYTKVGRFVYFQLDIDPNGATANATRVEISGLPFTSMAAQDGFGGAIVSYQASFDTNAGDIFHITSNSTTIVFYSSAGANRNGNSAGVDINARIILFGTYQTAT